MQKIYFWLLIELPQAFDEQLSVSSMKYLDRWKEQGFAVWAIVHTPIQSTHHSFINLLHISMKKEWIISTFRATKSLAYWLTFDLIWCSRLTPTVLAYVLLPTLWTCACGSKIATYLDKRILKELSLTLVRLGRRTRNCSFLKEPEVSTSNYNSHSSIVYTKKKYIL